MKDFNVGKLNFELTNGICEFQEESNGLISVLIRLYSSDNQSTLKFNIMGEGEYDVFTEIKGKNVSLIEGNPYFFVNHFDEYVKEYPNAQCYSTRMGTICASKDGVTREILINGSQTFLFRAFGKEVKESFRESGKYRGVNVGEFVQTKANNFKATNLTGQMIVKVIVEQEKTIEDFLTN